MPRLCWPTADGRPPRAALAAVLAVAAALALSAPLIEVPGGGLAAALGNLASFLGHFVAVPDWAYLPTLAEKLVETCEMAFLGTVAAAAVALPLGFLAARNTTPHPSLSHAVRALLSAMRSLPELVWAVAFVAAVGLGPLAGVAALSVVTVGYLGKFLAESLEAVPDGAIEGVLAHGASPMQVRAFAVLPNAWPDFLSVLFVVFDHNVRAATVLGLVGAGGLGYDMTMSMRMFQYDRLILIIAAVYLAVTVLDRLSDRLRRRVI